MEEYRANAKRTYYSSLSEGRADQCTLVIVAPKDPPPTITRPPARQLALLLSSPFPPPTHPTPAREPTRAPARPLAHSQWFARTRTRSAAPPAPICLPARSSARTPPALPAHLLARSVSLPKARD